MRAVLLATVLVLLMLLAGCGDLLSVQPLATKDNTVFDSSLLGEWSCDERDCHGMAMVRQLDPEQKEYDIVWVPNEGDEDALRLSGRLVKLGDRLVFDLEPRKPRPFDIPGHFFLLIEKQEEALRMYFLDSEWLRNRVQTEKSLAHVLILDKPVIIAPPGEIRSFLNKYGFDPQARADPLVMRRSGRR